MVDVLKVMQQEKVVLKSKSEEDVKPKGISPFDIIDSINTGVNMFDSIDHEYFESQYNSWIVNKGLSYFNDTIILTNIVNTHYTIDKKYQYLFLINTIGKRKRFSKWIKKSASSADIDLVKKVYCYSQKKAEIALSLLTEEQLSTLRMSNNKGGFANEGKLR